MESHTPQEVRVRVQEALRDQKVHYIYVHLSKSDTNGLEGGRVIGSEVYLFQG